MLLLLASVLGNKIGVFLLLLAYLEQNNYEQILICILICQVLLMWFVNLISTDLVKLFLNFALLFCNQL